MLLVLSVRLYDFDPQPALSLKLNKKKKEESLKKKTQKNGDLLTSYASLGLRKAQTEILSKPVC